MGTYAFEHQPFHENLEDTALEGYTKTFVPAPTPQLPPHELQLLLLGQVLLDRVVYPKIGPLNIREMNSEGESDQPLNRRVGNVRRREQIRYRWR